MITNVYVFLKRRFKLSCTGYMPCDTEYDQSNIAIYNEVLQDLVNIVNNENIDYCLCGGDFNDDLNATGLITCPHTSARSLHIFLCGGLGRCSSSQMGHTLYDHVNTMTIDQQATYSRTSFYIHKFDLPHRKKYCAK